MTEKWKDIKGYEGLYQVSDLGRVRSLDREDRLGRFKLGKIKAPCDNGRGYLCVNLKKDSKQKNKSVHRLVAEAFLPNPDNLPEINHKDGNKANNQVSNLEWCTRSENAKHAFKTGLNKQLKGVNNPQAKLTEADIAFIRSNCKPYDKEYSYAALARKYKVSEITIKYVVWGKHYAPLF